MSMPGVQNPHCKPWWGTESLLQCMQQAIIGGHSFHRGDRGAVGLHREHEARTHRLAVYQYSAGAARTVFAADMGSVSPRSSRNASASVRRGSTSILSRAPLIENSVLMPPPAFCSD
jgi:hypothetical protein